MFGSLIPHPLLTLLIVAVWILLSGFSWGAAVLGLFLGIVVPKLTSAFWPDRPVVKSPITIIEYALVVLWDIVVANFQVAYLILFAAETISAHSSLRCRSTLERPKRSPRLPERSP